VQFNYSYAGTVQQNGTPFYKFTSTAYVADHQRNSPANVTAANAMFLVDEWGHRPSLPYALRGERDRESPRETEIVPVSVTHTLTVARSDQIRSTSVTKPAWIETARRRVTENTTTGS